jgi:AcrR family transcriptional regulator
MRRMSPSPAPPGRKTQAERRSESARRLIESAIELFAERGYDATTMGAIAERAGYSRSLVNVRYGSKESLLDAVLRSQLEDRLLVEGADAENGLALALAPIDRVQKLLAEDEQLLRALLTILFEAVGPVPSLREHVIAWLSRLQQATVGALRAGQVDGSVRADAAIDVVVSELATFSIGFVYRWLLDDGYDLAGELAAWRERLRAQLVS